MEVTDCRAPGQCASVRGISQGWGAWRSDVLYQGPEVLGDMRGSQKAITPPQNWGGIQYN